MTIFYRPRRWPYNQDPSYTHGLATWAVVIASAILLGLVLGPLIVIVAAAVH